jgi:hypothetical protein
MPITVDWYLADPLSARKNAVNLMTEKYARMMRQTFPEEYKKYQVFFCGSAPEHDLKRSSKFDWTDAITFTAVFKIPTFNRFFQPGFSDPSV